MKKRKELPFSTLATIGIIAGLVFSFTIVLIDRPTRTAPVNRPAFALSVETRGSGDSLEFRVITNAPGSTSLIASLLLMERGQKQEQPAWWNRHGSIYSSAAELARWTPMPVLDLTDKARRRMQRNPEKRSAVLITPGHLEVRTMDSDPIRLAVLHSVRSNP